MSGVTSLFVAAGALALAALVIYMVAQKLLSPGQSVLWLMVALAALLVSAWPALFFRISTALGARSAVSTLSFMGLVYFALYSLYLTARLTRLEERMERMAIDRGVSGLDASDEDAGPSGTSSGKGG